MTRCAVLLVFAFFSSAFSNAHATATGSIGYYANGSLDSNARIIGTEVGLLRIFTERDRGYGNQVLIDLLIALGLAYQTEFPFPHERIQVGDLSQQGGGKISGHGSHQNGLDVDLVYLRKDFRETESGRGADAGFDEEFVVDGKVTSNFDGARNWWALRWLAESGRVDRIFVAKEIKKYFCERADEYESEDVLLRTEILRLLRPWPSHGNHFHVRLECPQTDNKCVGSLPVPPGTGCDDIEGFEPTEGFAPVFEAVEGC